MTDRCHDIASAGVYLRGAFGEGNLGDDLLCLAAVGLVSRLLPPGRITVGIRSDQPDLLETRVRRTMGAPGPADMVVFAGGTQLFSFRPDTLPELADRAKRLAWRCLRRHAPPSRRAGPLAAISIGIGPFEVPGTGRAARSLLREMAFVSVRDSLSAALCRKWHVPFCQSADLCFDTSTWLAQPGFPMRRAGSCPSVLIVVRDWPRRAASIRMWRGIREALRQLRNDGLQVDIGVFAAHADRDCTLRLPDETIWCPQGDAQAVIHQLARYDLIVSARYHGLVLACLLGIPAVAIDLEPKLGVAARDLGAAAWRPPFEAAQLYRLASLLLRDWSDASERVAVTRTENFQRASAGNLAFIEWLAANGLR